MESSDSCWVKTETEDDEDETTGDTMTPSTRSPRVERVSKHRKATEFFGNPVPSSFTGMVGSVVEQKEIDAGELVKES